MPKTKSFWKFESMLIAPTVPHGHHNVSFLSVCSHFGSILQVTVYFTWLFCASWMFPGEVWMRYFVSVSITVTNTCVLSQNVSDNLMQLLHIQCAFCSCSHFPRVNHNLILVMRHAKIGYPWINRCAPSLNKYLVE